MVKSMASHNWQMYVKEEYGTVAPGQLLAYPLNVLQVSISTTFYEQLFKCVFSPDFLFNITRLKWSLWAKPKVIGLTEWY